MKKTLATLLAIVMLVSLTAFAQAETAEASKYGGHLNTAFYAKPTRLDPSKATGAWYYPITNLVFESPLVKDGEGNIRPNVCNFELSEDQLTLKLWVRDGVTFHDGSAVEIEDVIASIKRCVHKSPRGFVTPFIKDIVIDENKVATITFTEYNEKTMYYIACVNPFLGVMPKEIAEKYSYESGEFITAVEDTIGTGPYKLVELVDSVSVTVERYDGYVPVEPGYTGYAAPKMAYLDSITIYANTDASTSTLALMDGTYDLFADCPVDFEAQLQAKGIESNGKLATTGACLIMNTFGNGVAKDANMRKAMLAAIDIPEFVNFMTDGRVEKGGFCPVTDSMYYTDVFETADYMGEDDVELAKKYMAAANYQGEEVQLALSSAYADVATLLASYFDAAGIKYVVTMMEAGTVSEFYANKENAWDIYYTSPSMNATPTLLSTTVMNTDYNSPAKDALLQELQGMVVGSEEYVNKWFELANQMVEDCGIVFLHENALTWYFDPDLNFDYVGTAPYLFNAYWDNPQEHGK